MNSIDFLTGFLDRFGCLQTAQKLASESMISGNTFAVIWIDIDRFKQINESFGHLGGNEVIKDLATRFRNRVSGRAELSRMSGDEFVILIPKCDRSQAQLLACELSSTVDEPIIMGNLTLRPSASIGIAIQDPGEDSLTMLELAERARLRQKLKAETVSFVQVTNQSPVVWELSLPAKKSRSRVSCTLRWKLVDYACTISRSYARTDK
jgi:diguanylate cyclase (GGDEF)-like protein